MPIVNNANDFESNWLCHCQLASNSICTQKIIYLFAWLKMIWLNINSRRTLICLCCSYRNTTTNRNKLRSKWYDLTFFLRLFVLSVSKYKIMKEWKTIAVQSPNSSIEGKPIPWWQTASSSGMGQGPSRTAASRRDRKQWKSAKTEEIYVNRKSIGGCSIFHISSAIASRAHTHPQHRLAFRAFVYLFI